MLNKTKNIITNHRSKITDVNFIGQVVLVVVALLVSWSTIQAIQLNYNLQQQVAELEQKVQIQQLEVDNLRLRNQYLETDTFLELAARRQFGKAAEGEQVLMVPKEVAQSFIDDGDNDQLELKEEKKAPYQQNLEAWKNFFF